MPATNQFACGKQWEAVTTQEPESRRQRRKMYKFPHFTFITYVWFYPYLGPGSRKLDRKMATGYTFTIVIAI
jgi:hypothetical protein